MLLLPRFLAGSDTRSSVEELALITSRLCGQLHEVYFKKKKKDNKMFSKEVIGLVPFGVWISENCKALCLVICES